jgi:hypothetical protein
MRARRGEGQASKQCETTAQLTKSAKLWYALCDQTHDVYRGFDDRVVSRLDYIIYHSKIKDQLAAELNADGQSDEEHQRHDALLRFFDFFRNGRPRHSD